MAGIFLVVLAGTMCQIAGLLIILRMARAWKNYPRLHAALHEITPQLLDAGPYRTPPAILGPAGGRDEPFQPTFAANYSISDPPRWSSYESLSAKEARCKSLLVTLLRMTNDPPHTSEELRIRDLAEHAWSTSTGETYTKATSTIAKMQPTMDGRGLYCVALARGILDR